MNPVRARPSTPGDLVRLLALAGALSALLLGCVTQPLVGQAPAQESPPNLEDALPVFLEESEVDVPAALRGPLDPIYPDQALYDRVEADVTARVAITADGRLAGLAILKAPDPAFGTAAEQAIRRASFAPARKDRGPVASTVTLRIRFRLDD